MNFSDRDFGKWASKTIAPEVRARASKVAALAARGATPGEKSAAENRLAAIADRAGVSVDSLRKLA